jgi:PAS domain S-box-containing protein
MADLAAGDQVCWLYESDAEYRTLLAAFVRLGLERGERVVVVADAGQCEALPARLQEEGVAAAEGLAGGQLRLLEAGATYLPGGRFDPAAALAWLQDETGRALAAGYQGLRLNSDMVWAQRGQAGSEPLLAFAAGLAGWLPASRCLAVAAYDRRQFEAVQLMEALAAHPVAMVGSQVCDNLYYLPKGDSQGRAAADLQRRLGELLTHRRLASAFERSQRQLRADKVLLEGLFEAAPDAIVLVDTAGRIVQLNRRAETMFGYRRQELVDQALEILLPARFREQHVAHRAAYYAQPHSRPMGAGVELVGRRKDGGEFPADIMLSPLETADGWLVISAVRDLSQRKQAERELQESETRFRTMFEGAAIGIALLDLQGRVMASNHALQQLLGYGEPELRGLALSGLSYPEDLAANQRVFQELLTGPRAGYRLEQRFLRRDRQPVWGSLTLSLVRDGQGTPQFAIGMVKDISERKGMEADLAELQHRLMEGRETERLHLAQELHDGPLQELYSIAYQLKELEGDVSGAAGLARLAGLQASLQQVMQLIRTVSGELRPPALAPFGLEKAIRSHAERFQAAHPELAVRLELTRDDQTLPEPVRMALYRIYQQALSNVARHAQASVVVIRFHLNSRQASLEVQDDGDGFEVPQRWINLARQGHLGLVGSAERAEACGGQLTIVSAPGQGTLIKVSVPLPDAARPRRRAGEE